MDDDQLIIALYRRGLSKIGSGYIRRIGMVLGTTGNDSDSSECIRHGI